jgi:hypothetical protein
MMVTDASQTRESVGLNKPVYRPVIASESSGTMKRRRAASEREPPAHEQPGHCVQLRLCEAPLSPLEHLPDLLEQS